MEGGRKDFCTYLFYFRGLCGSIQSSLRDHHPMYHQRWCKPSGIHGKYAPFFSRRCYRPGGTYSEFKQFIDLTVCRMCSGQAKDAFDASCVSFAGVHLKSA